MAEGQPAPRSGVSPYLTIRLQHGQQAIEFYKRAFAAEELSRMLAEDGVRVMHAHLVINGGSVMLSDDFPEYHSLVDAPPPEGVTLHIDVGDADAWWERAVQAGAEVKMPLADQFWGARYGQLKDPFGHSWSIGGPVKGGSDG
jgi:PhnB protein